MDYWSDILEEDPFNQDALFWLILGFSEDQEKYIKKGKMINPLFFNLLSLINCSNKYCFKNAEKLVKDIQFSEKRSYIYFIFGSYYRGKDELMSLKFYKESSKLGNIFGEVMVNLINHEIFNYPLGKNYEKLVKIDERNTFKNFFMGYYFDYIGLKQKMKKYYQKEINIGNTNAMVNLACYYKQKQDEKSIVKSNALIKHAAKLGNITAMVCSGSLIESNEFSINNKIVKMQELDGQIGAFLCTDNEHLELLNFTEQAIKRDNCVAMKNMAKYHFNKIKHIYSTTIIFDDFYEIDEELKEKYNNLFWKEAEKSRKLMTKYFIMALENGYYFKEEIPIIFWKKAIIQNNFHKIESHCKRLLPNICEKVDKFKIDSIDICVYCLKIKEIMKLEKSNCCLSCFVDFF